MFPKEENGPLMYKLNLKPVKGTVYLFNMIHFVNYSLLKFYFYKRLLPPVITIIPNNDNNPINDYTSGTYYVVMIL